MYIPQASISLKISIFTATNEVWGKVMFLHMSVILSTGEGPVLCYFLSGCLVPCSFQGVSVQEISIQGRGLCPGEGSLSRGGISVQGRVSVKGRGSLSRAKVSVQGSGLCPGMGLCPGERSLSRRGVSVHGEGFSVQGRGLCPRRGLCPGVGLCPGEGSVSGGSLSRGGVICPWGGVLCPREGSLSRCGSLSRGGVCVWWVSVEAGHCLGDLCQGDITVR